MGLDQNSSRRVMPNEQRVNSSQLNLLFNSFNNSPNQKQAGCREDDSENGKEVI